MISAGVALFFAVGFYAQWDTYLRFRYGGSFGVADPLFGVDVGFYVFHLPFYELLQTSLMLLTVLTLAVVAPDLRVLRLTAGQQQRKDRGSEQGHVTSICASVYSGCRLGIWALPRSLQPRLLHSGRRLWRRLRGGSCDEDCLVDHGRRLGGRVCRCSRSISSARASERCSWDRRSTWPSMSSASLLLPVVFEKFFVQPSELALETPYLKNYIEFTRKAYQLDAIQETSYPALADLTPAVLARNQDTIQNIRLWDARPLLQTYQQTQAIRLYYQFYNVGVDRYHLADGYHQVMLATRELSPELPAKAQTWVNQYLQFTHGYGVVMNFVSKKVGGGFPKYLLENVPAESAYGLNITQPAIYYGESMPGYRIVATGIKEFDYPKGNDNVYTSYSGKGGIPLDSFWKKLLFSWTQKDVNILLTSYLRPESRIQIWRTVQERVAQIAPFLRLDTDPYPVLSAGKLYWIQDAYTDSDQFPYADPHGTGFGNNLNYIRNSVKVVVDMYDGTVSFYVMDPKDPVLAVYRRAFPGVFKDLDQLSADLKAAPALPGGSLRHPGRRVQNLSHDRSSGLLQPRRSVGVPQGDVRGRSRSRWSPITS